MVKHRRPTQHWRYYRSGRHTFVNRGVRYMVAKYAIPHWLLDQLNEEQRKEAEKMLAQGENIGAVAEHFGIIHPSAGSRRPYIHWSRQQKIQRLKELAEQLGRVPSESDLPSNYPVTNAFAYEFGSWNEALKAADLQPTIQNIREEVQERIQRLGHIPTKKEIAAEYQKKWITNLPQEKREEYARSDREYHREKDANMSPEEKEEQLRKEREWYANIPPEKKEEYLRKQKEWHRQHKK